MARSNPLTLATLVCLAALFAVANASSVLTLTPGDWSRKPAGASSVIIEFDLTAEKGSWVFEIVPDTTTTSMQIITPSGSSTHQWGTFKVTVQSGLWFKYTVQGNGMFETRVYKPLSTGAIVAMAVGIPLGVLLLCVLVGRRTLKREVHGEQLTRINFRGCMLFGLVIAAAPFVLLVIGLAVDVLWMRVVGGTIAGVCLFLSGHRSVEVSAAAKTVTTTRYVLIVVPLHSTVIGFKEIDFFFPTAQRGNRGTVWHGIGLQRVAGGGIVNLHGVAASARKQPFYEDVQRLNELIRRETPDVTRSQAPTLPSSALASVAVEQHLLAESSLPVAQLTPEQAAAEQAAIQAQIEALRQREQALAPVAAEHNDKGTGGAQGVAGPAPSRAAAAAPVTISDVAPSVPVSPEDDDDDDDAAVSPPPASGEGDSEARLPTLPGADNGKPGPGPI